MSSIDVTIENRRPLRSASQPKTKPPIGRMTKPTAKIASVASSASVGVSSAKNWAAKNDAKIA